jgi:hypothetical protein
MFWDYDMHSTTMSFNHSMAAAGGLRVVSVVVVMMLMLEQQILKTTVESYVSSWYTEPITVRQQRIVRD